jgi:O-antigen/teichoic acid export membrane protein
MDYPAKEKIHAFLNKGNERTILTKKNIAASFLIKCVTILISLVLPPMIIAYANAERNGIWVATYTLITCLAVFDIGFGNGMKNKVAEAKAEGKTELAKKYVSSTYAIVSLICLGIFGVFCLINPFLNWNEILNIPDIYAGETTAFIWIAIIAFCFTFIFNLMKSVVAADQYPAIGSLLDMIGQLLTLIGIFILMKTTPPSLISLGFVTCFAPVVVQVIGNLVLFRSRYKAWKPDLHFVDFSLAYDMMKLGIKFFIASFASLLLTQTIPYLIQYMTNPTEVTNYNIAFKLFSLGFNVVGIIILPYWSSFTDAYAKEDFEWMKRSISYLHKLFVVLLVCQLLALVVSPLLYYVWVDFWLKENPLNIPFAMSLSVCLNLCVLCWLTICIYPLNGIGKVKLQVYSSIVEILLFIPIAFLLGKYWGATGIILTPVVVWIPRIIWAPIQLKKLINQKATGIWNK